MKTFLFTFLFLLLVSAACAQPPDTLWTRAYGGPDIDDAYSVALAPDGGFLIVGRSRLSSQFDYLAVRVDAMGDTVWTRRYGGASSDVAYGVCATRDSGFAIAGSSMSYGAGAADMYLVRINSQGDTLWTHAYGGPTNDVAYTVQRTADNGFALAGTSELAGSATDFRLVKTDSTGALQWSRNYGTTAVELFGGLQQTSDGGYVLVGTTYIGGASDTQIYLVRTDSDGDTLWVRTFGTPFVDYGTSVRESSYGGYIIGGTLTADSGQDAGLVKVDAAGALQWMHTYGFAGLERGTVVRQGSDGGYILGVVTDHFGGSYDFYFVKTGPLGDTLWTRHNGGSADEWLASLEVTSDGGYIAVGNTLSYGHGSSDFYAVRLPGVSAVGGYIRNSEDQSPLPNVYVGAIGQPNRVRTDLLGHYVLSLPPGQAYDIIIYGQCVARDTAFDQMVLQDSVVALNFQTGLPHGFAAQTSVNMIVRNHMRTTDTLRLWNTGAGILDYSVNCVPHSPASAWLSVEPPQGMVFPDSSFGVVVVVTADTTDDGVYDYDGFLTVHVNSCPDSVLHIPVTASVLEAERHAAVPRRFDLSAFPNPFNPQTTITFSVPYRTAAVLAVYDVMGREVKRLSADILNTGDYRISFDASALPSGLYFVRLSTSQEMLTRKILLLK